jgi:hypothetical protein
MLPRHRLLVIGGIAVGGGGAGSQQASSSSSSSFSSSGGGAVAAEAPSRGAWLLRTEATPLRWEAVPPCPARGGVALHSATFVPERVHGPGASASGGAMASAAQTSGSSHDSGHGLEGQVVVIGGCGAGGQRSMLSSAAFHSAPPCSWSRRDAVKEAGYPPPRQSHTATLVDDGRIFLCGGCSDKGVPLPDEV